MTRRFLEIYKKLSDETDLGIYETTSSEQQDIFSACAFETRALFTLADFLKSLEPNEYYDIAQKAYN